MDLLKEIIKKKKQEIKAGPINHPEPIIKPTKSPEIVESTEKIIPLQQSEIIFRLRKLKQPAKYFGETLLDQYNRLQKAEEAFIETRKAHKEPEIDLASIEELFPADRNLLVQSIYIDQAKECQECENSGKVWKKEKWKHPFIEETQALGYADKSLVICLFCKMVLDEWKTDLQQGNVNVYENTLATFKKLVGFLKMQTLNEAVVDQMFLAARFCQIKNYQKAYDAHLHLSSMESFHKNEHGSGHLHSDLAFRKVAQTFKRIITITERMHPGI